MKSKLLRFQTALRRRSGGSPSPSPLPAVINKFVSCGPEHSPAKFSESLSKDCIGDRDPVWNSGPANSSGKADDSPRLPDVDWNDSLSPTSKLGYWDDAHGQLLEKNPEIAAKLDELLRSNPATLGVLDRDLRHTVYENLRKITDRQWRVRWGTRNVSIREQLDKIAAAIQIFSAFGNVASNLDPLHAGLAWAGVSILIPIIVNFSEQEKAAKSGLDKITHLIARYAIVEQKVLMNMDREILNEIEASLVDLYAKVLEYQVVAACYYGKHTIQRYVRAIPKLDDFTGLLVEIQEKDDACRGLLQLETSTAVSRQSRQLSQTLFAVERSLEKFSREDQENEDVLLWLSEVRYGADHEQARLRLGSKYTKTGRWLFQNSDFAAWRCFPRDNRPILWLRGPVGTGKTCLMSIAIQDCLENLESSAESSFAYFYCSSKGQQPSSPLDVLRCLVSQLAWSTDGSTLSPIVKELHARANRVSGTGRPDLNSCTELLIALGQEVPQIFIMIDALDECSEVFTLLACLQTVVNNLRGRMRLLFSSRMHVDISDYFPGCRTIGIEQNSQDIDYYIQTEISCRKLRLPRSTPLGFEERLKDVLSRRADNMFRWVELPLETFFSPKSRLIHFKDIVAKLNQLEVETISGTEGLNAVYDEIYEMNTPQPHIRTLATKALQWVLLSSLPVVPGFKTNREAMAMMKCSELAHAVSIDVDGSRDPSVDEEYILNICSNLIVVKEDRFQLAHLSVAEYLRSKRTRSIDSEILYSENKIRNQVALSCLSSLLCKSECDVFKRFGFNLDFGRYATQWWPYHYRSCTASQALQSTYKRFMTADGGFYLKQWMRNYIANSSKTSPGILFEEILVNGKPDPLFVAAVFGFQPPFDNPECTDLQIRNGNGRSYLDVAAKYGWPLLIERLWKIGDHQSRDASKALLSVVSPGSMLIWGSGDYATVINALLGFGADIECRNELIKTPLMLSGELQYKEIFGALFGNGADIGATDVDGNTFFHLLFDKETFNPSDNYWIWSLIQETGNLNIRNRKGETPLHILLRKSCDGFLWKTVRLYFMKRLLDNGADVHIPDNDGITPQMLSDYQYDRHVEDYYNAHQYDVSLDNLTDLKLLLYT